MSNKAFIADHPLIQHKGHPAAGQKHGVQGVPGADSGDHPADVL